MLSENEPFLIRGHHIEFFRYVLISHPEIINPREKSEAISFEHITNILQQGDSYKIDILGINEANIEKHREKISKIILQFLTFPDDQPVRIVKNNLDDICKSCVIGKHCQQKKFGDFYVPMAWFLMGLKELIQYYKTDEIDMTFGKLKQKLLEG